ncbi:MAG: glycosyltransferase involved in cell wall biosynthesis [Candidatus Woesearchaeota archaeon]|jgi:glycosyltransferase involved in cell wall biosynthesis
MSIQKKVVWITNFPNQAVYTPMYETLGTISNYNLTMYCPDKVAARKNTSNIFTLKFFKVFELTKLINIITLSAFSKERKIDLAFSVGFKEFTKTMDKEKPDILISNMWTNVFTWQAARYAKKRKIPFLFIPEMQRYPNSFLGKLFTKMTLPIMRRLVFRHAAKITPWTQQAVTFAQHNFGVQKKKIIHLPPGVNITRFKPTKKKKNKQFTLLMVARCVPYKRHKDVIDAVQVLKEKGITVNVHFVVGGPYQKEIEDHIKTKQLNKQITFLQRTPHAQLYKVFNDHDAFILPSYNEAIGMVIPEALACSLPCIVSDTCGGNQYITKDCGVIHKTKNVKSIANSIESLMKRDLLHMQKNARAIAEKNYSLEVCAKRWKKILDSASK